MSVFSDIGTQAAKDMAEALKNAEGFLTNAIDELLDGMLSAAEARASQTKDRLEAALAGPDGRFAEEDARERVSDAEAALAKAMEGGDAEGISDAQRALRRANNGLVDQLLERSGGFWTDEARAVASAAGWSRSEIVNASNAFFANQNAQGALAATQGAATNYTIEVKTLDGQLSEAAIQRLIQIVEEIQRRKGYGA